MNNAKKSLTFDSVSYIIHYEQAKHPTVLWDTLTWLSWGAGLYYKQRERWYL